MFSVQTGQSTYLNFVQYYKIASATVWPHNDKTKWECE
jgi:hypothetical protein